MARNWQIGTSSTAKKLVNIDNQLWICDGSRILVYDPNFVRRDPILLPWAETINDATKINGDIIVAATNGIFGM